MKNYFICFLITILLTNQGFSNTFNVPQNYPTISLALNACTANDSVLVGSGTYLENISWPAVQGIKLISINGPISTIIDGSSNGHVIEISTGSLSAPPTIIEGFTIQNGYFVATSAYGLNTGSGIAINRSHVLLNDLIVKNNVLDGSNYSFGAGIFCDSSVVTISHSEIKENIIASGQWSYGAGICGQSGTLTIDHCKVSNNESTSSGCNYGAGVTEIVGNLIINSTRITNNTLHGNSSFNNGAGVYFDSEGSNADFTNCLIADNVVGQSSTSHSVGGIYVQAKQYISIGVMNVTHCTIANNGSGSQTRGNSLYLNFPSFALELIVNVTNSILWSNCATEIDTAGCVMTVLNSDIQGNAGWGLNCINLNPMFVSATDYHLTAPSPCNNKGIQMVNLDIDDTVRPKPSGTLPDMGCFESGDFTSGAISSIEYQSPFIERIENAVVKISFEKGLCRIFSIDGKLLLNRKIDSVADTYFDLSEFSVNQFFLEFITTDNSRRKSERVFLW